MAALNLRKSSQTSIMRLKAEIEADGYAPDSVQIDHTLNTLSRHYNRFMENHMVLVGAAEDDEMDAHDALLAKVELEYGVATVKLQRLRAIEVEHSEFASVRGMAEIRLDPVKLPTFDGRPENWLVFKDMFESLVHNRLELDPTYKLSRLRQCVKEDAVPMVGGVYTGGYDQVWADLKRRYDNPRRLVESHVNRLLDLPDHPSESQRCIRNVIDVVRSTLRALTVMKLPTDQWDGIMYPIVLRKLPAAAVAYWTVATHSDMIPSLKLMLEQIETYADTRPNEATSSTRRQISQRSAKSHVATSSSTSTAVKITQACPNCAEPHHLSKCQRFRALTLGRRMDLVRQASLCYNCLSAGHMAWTCPSGVCHTCKQKHNTLLCKSTTIAEGPNMVMAQPRNNSRSPLNGAPSVAPVRSTAPQVLSRVDAAQSLLAQSEGMVLLATAVASILDGCGEERECRLLCDMGSQVSFLSESFFKRLNLPRRRNTLAVEGIGAQRATASRGQTTLTMRSRLDPTFEMSFEAHILPAITSAIPAAPIDMSRYEHLKTLEFADPTFHIPGQVDALIGADVWGMLLLGGVITGGPEQPCALHTRLGWVICGPVSLRSISLPALRALPERDDDGERLDDLLQRFWELEEVPCPTQTDDRCEEIFSNTVSRTLEGRYVVQIPFRSEAPALGDSFTQALRQFLRLERRLINAPELRQKYIDFMREYVTLGHMEEALTHCNDSSEVYYIPHHAVTGKFRVVFNASAKTSSGMSLNDLQLVGPQLQDHLVNILLRFRRFSVAITADVEKMFRQVLVDPRHRQWQQILWRESPDDPLRTYQLTTVTYGMACSPFNAIRALRQCASDNYGVIGNDHRATAARDSILQNFYVDDFLESADSSEEAITLAKDVNNILQEGRFCLRKWNSNSVEALTAITNSWSSTAELSIGDSSTKVLGLHWDPSSDELLFEVKLTDVNCIPTKRTILSDIARIFDPLGLLAPVTITAKMFMQLTWAAQIDWDTPLPPELREKWLKFRCSLPQIANLRIARWFGMTRSANVTLHGFCDASSKAYAAVIYVRSMDADGHTRVTLLTARTKVAPLKAVTIPRLELCAANLLVNTMVHIREALQLVDVPCTYWSDSSIVLSWIRKPPTSFMQYVSNRVTSIQRNSDVSCWHHIRSEDNPADCASRGLSPTAISDFPLWWEGPRCIYSDDAQPMHPLPLGSLDQEVHDSELRRVRAHVCILSAPKIQVRIGNESEAVFVPLIERFSSLKRILHTTSYILRFRPAGRPHWRNPVITTEEIEQALVLLIREAQGKAYSSDINHLRASCSVAPSSKLLPLSPFLDEAGVLRVGGRLNNAELEYEQQHPMIVPKESPLALLLVNDAHNATLHGGIKGMLQFLRRRFWIVHGRSLVKRCIHDCRVCKLHQRALQQQQMAALPRSRVVAAPPFSNTGVDYAGPFLVRCGSKRSTSSTKSYAVIFVCMCTKAVHIELAEDLSTRAFLDVFDRFVSRRGYCLNLYSDNGTQFVGADRQLQADLREWTSTYAQQQLANAGVHWHFITPAAPHHGGLWEAAVRSAKKHLRRVVGEQSLTFYQLSTLLVRIEACLNSRPILAIYDDPECGTALTPGDFLIGRPLNSRPEGTVPDVHENRLKYHQRLQRMYQHFWQRWQNEYLNELQARSKWARPVPNLQVDDIVAIKQENLPPTRWRIGRITQVHPGSDGLVRVVTIEYCTDRTTAGGVLTKSQCKRPVQRVCRIIEAGESILSPQDPAGEDV